MKNSRKDDIKRVIRAMPNTPVIVQEGATVYASGSDAKEEDHDTVTNLFNSVGRCWKMDEEYLDIVTALSGCGPAFVSIVYTIKPVHMLC